MTPLHAAIFFGVLLQSGGWFGIHYTPGFLQLSTLTSASQVLGFLGVRHHAWLTVSASTKTVGHSEHAIITSSELLNLVPMRCRLSPRKPTASLVSSPNLL